MKKFITLIISIIMMGSVSVVMARDASRDSLMHILKEQAASQKRWEAVERATSPAERDEALKNYYYNLPERWAPPPSS
jgi:hypothetical protein